MVDWLRKEKEGNKENIQISDTVILNTAFAFGLLISENKGHKENTQQKDKMCLQGHEERGKMTDTSCSSSIPETARCRILQAIEMNNRNYPIEMFSLHSSGWPKNQLKLVCKHHPGTPQEVVKMH